MKVALAYRTIKPAMRALALHGSVKPLRISCLVLAAALLAMTEMSTAEVLTGNIVPNPSLRGEQGAIVESNATITGTAPTLWRAFAVEGGDMSLERIALGADDLFPGSPPSQAVKLTVATFGADQGFDHATALFSFRPGNDYRARVYARTGNSDNSSQPFNVSMPIFDGELNFTGRDPANFTANAGAAWAAFDSPVVAGEAGDAYAHVAIRLVDNGGENSVIVALPDVLGPALYNLAPNSGFSGDAGAIQGAVTGSVPNDWRAFAIAGGTLDVSTVPLAAGTLFPGSAPTQAVRLAVTGGDGVSEGFDHELVRSILSSDYLHRGELYVRSGNSNMSDQSFVVTMPIFDTSGTYTGEQPGAFAATAGPEWRYFAGPSFTADANETTDLSIRLNADGGQDVLLVARPYIVGPAGPVIFLDGFELD